MQGLKKSIFLLAFRSFFVTLHPPKIRNMAKNSKWQDDYWLLLMQVYLRRPVGVKPLYSRDMVALSMELHIAPQVLFSKMCQLASIDTPRIERIWETYGSNPRRLSRAVRLLREMKGFGRADEFYDGVEVNETFEKDFKPCVKEPVELTPVMLILILDLYVRLTPITMVPETPEVTELARLIKEHNIGFSEGSIVGILTDMVDIIRGQLLMGQPVKLLDHQTADGICHRRRRCVEISPFHPHARHGYNTAFLRHQRII